MNIWGEKLASNSTNFAINMLYPLENRLVSYILAFLNYDDENECDGSWQMYLHEKDEINFKFEGNFIEIAELLGSSYRHLNRVLNKMCRENIIRKNGKSYSILNIKRLIELSGELYK